MALPLAYRRGLHHAVSVTEWFLLNSFSRLAYYNGSDTRPDYYRNLPSYWVNFNNDNPEMEAYYTDLWQNDESFRQLDWDSFYRANYLNNVQNESLPDSEKKGSTYIQRSGRVSEPL